MRSLFVVLCTFLISCGESPPDTKKTEELVVKVNTEKKGIQIWSMDGDQLGYSPVVIHQEVKVLRSGASEIVRYFIEDSEIHPGENWHLKLKIFQDGYPEEVTLLVPFQPGQWSQEVTFKKKPSKSP